MTDPTIADVLVAITALGARVDARFDSVHLRIDGIHGRIDTVIDSLADLRRDFTALAAEYRTHGHGDA